MPEPETLLADRDLLFEAVREAGELALTMQRQQVRKWTKSDGSPVTEADIAVDALLSRRLRSERLRYGWLSEESQSDATRTERRLAWLVDPIDGTRGFAQGGNNWCVAAALVEDGRPVVAAVYRPMVEEFFAAVLGQGATLNGAALQVSDGAALDGARLIGNRKSLQPLLDRGIAPDHSGNLPLQLRLAEVAAGRSDGTVSVGLKNDWDLAAGDLLVHEAGGRVSDLNGEVFVFNRRQPWQRGLAAANTARQSAILEIVGHA